MLNYLIYGAVFIKRQKEDNKIKNANTINDFEAQKYPKTSKYYF